MVIHKGERVQTQWTWDVPVGVCIAATSKGYITKQKFHELGLLGSSKHTESWKSHTCLLLTLTRVMCIMWHFLTV